VGIKARCETTIAARFANNGDLAALRDMPAMPSPMRSFIPTNLSELGPSAAANVRNSRFSSRIRAEAPVALRAPVAK
jgi:hypothetical protein